MVPAIDERAGDRAEQQVRQRRRHEYERGRRAVNPSATKTIAARATWWTRSPNSEISWPDQRAAERAIEREPDVRVAADALAEDVR